MAIVYKSNGLLKESRSAVKEYIIKKKNNNPNYTVLDLGGAANPWCDELVDVYVDCYDMNLPTKRQIIGDILDVDTWKKIKEVAPDFVICTHTLEDLRDPIFVLNNINNLQVSAGYISMPNKYTELSNIESMLFVGYSHHRWIFSLNEDVLNIVAKWGMANIFSYYSKWNYFFQRLPILGKIIANKNDTLNWLPKPILPWYNKKLGNGRNELGFIFEEKIEFIQIDNDYALSTRRLYEVYIKELAKGL